MPAHHHLETYLQRVCHRHFGQIANVPCIRHVGKASPGGRKASRPSETSSLLDSRRALRESRVRPWFANGTAGASPQRPSVDNSKAAASRLQDIRTRIQARNQATASLLARSQASRLPARSQAPTMAAPEKLSTFQARSQASRIPVRSQAATRKVPEKVSRLLPLAESKAFTCALAREQAIARVRESKVGFASAASRPKTVAKHLGSRPERAAPEALAIRPARLPSSKSSTLPSGGQLSLKTRLDGGVAAACSAVVVPKSKTKHTAPGDVSSLPAGVFEKIRREGSDGPAFTLKQVSWKFANRYENIFSPPRTRVIVSPEPEKEVGVNRTPRRLSRTPHYERLYTTPRNEDCARPRRRPMAPPMPVSPPDQSVRWPETSETRLTSAGSVADEAASECSQGIKVSGSSDRSRSLHLSHRLGSAGHRVPAHRSAAPAGSALRTGSSRMAKQRVVRFDDNVRERIVSRWMTEAYPDHRKYAGVITGWTPDPDWDSDPEHPSDSAHIRVWSNHPQEWNHHVYHRPGSFGLADGGRPIWGNVSGCAPHLREIDWRLPCPFQNYRVPVTKDLGVQGGCTCEQSGPFDCPRKVYRKRLDLAYVSQTCRGPNEGKLAVLRFVLSKMNWSRGVAVIPRSQ